MLTEHQDEQHQVNESQKAAQECRCRVHVQVKPRGFYGSRVSNRHQGRLQYYGTWIVTWQQQSLACTLFSINNKNNGSLFSSFLPRCLFSKPSVKLSYSTTLWSNLLHLRLLSFLLYGHYFRAGIRDLSTPVTLIMSIVRLAFPDNSYQFPDTQVLSDQEKSFPDSGQGEPRTETFCRVQ